MKHTNEELVKAAEILKTNCEYSNLCQSCPFETDMKYCTINGYPIDWKLGKLEGNK